MPLPEIELDGPDAWYLDGFNLLHACVLKGRNRARWWAEESQRTLLAWLADFPSRHSVSVFFDASRAESDKAVFDSDAEVLFAPSADDAIVRRLEQEPSPEGVCVVTADRALQERCRARRAQILRPWAFQALLQTDRTHAGDSATTPASSGSDHPPQSSGELADIAGTE